MRTVDLTGGQPSCTLTFADSAEQEAEEIFLWMQSNISDSFAIQWYAGLFEETKKIALQPRFYPIAPENERFHVEIRHMYYRRKRVIYRALYHIVEPVEGETTGTIRILHIRHAARLPIGETETEDS